jgi:hypothetical protein
MFYPSNLDAWTEAILSNANIDKASIWNTLHYWPNKLKKVGYHCHLQLIYLHEVVHYATTIVANWKLYINTVIMKSTYVKI